MNRPTVKRCTQFERFVVVAGLSAVFGAATGREDGAAAQEATSCAQIATAAERLACYDRALPPPEAPAEIEPPVAPLHASPVQSSPLVEAATGTAAAGNATDGKPEDASIVVVGMRKYPGRSASFTTDKGDVWIQIGAESVYLPKVPFDAELRPASMGTFFLRPSDYGWRVHVRRSD